ncbi:MAG: aldehyde dehydrogenase family protein, partial [Phycisphaerae bacterium]|nr:aldehyde dehydrogenase family protein [Phycisphaerae bacterium]
MRHAAAGTVAAGRSRHHRRFHAARQHAPGCASTGGDGESRQARSARRLLGHLHAHESRLEDGDPRERRHRVESREGERTGRDALPSRSGQELLRDGERQSAVGSCACRRRARESAHHRRRNDRPVAATGERRAGDAEQRRQSAGQSIRHGTALAATVGLALNARGAPNRASGVSAVIEELGNIIDGSERPPRRGRWIDVVEPATGAAFARCAASDSADVDDAVASATRALPEWSRMPVERRASLMEALAAIVERDLEKFARAESIDSGKPIALARSMDIPRAVTNLRYFANLAREQAKAPERSETDAIFPGGKRGPARSEG